MEPILMPDRLNPDRILLRWRDEIQITVWSTTPSDGSIRAIALITAPATT